MISYKEDEFLQLSGIQHFAFCRRQWALAYIELQWSENVRTVEGKIMHDRAHDPFLNEKRKDIIISRAMPIHSYTLGVSGECDIVEFHRGKKGVPLFGREGLYEAIPIEYKRGIPKKDDIDELQLTAEAMCLEEMLNYTEQIPFGYLFYGETMRRVKVTFSEKLRENVRQSFKEMHELYHKRHVPKVKRRRSCNACSLKEICLPVILNKTSVDDYIASHILSGE